MSRGAVLIIVTCLALAIAGCGGGDDSSSSSSSSTQAKGESTSQVTSEDPSVLQTKPKVVVPKEPPPPQLFENELVVGKPPPIKDGDKVTVQYVGVNYKTGKQFDSSWDRNEPFSFTVGAGEVIDGWERGVKGMGVDSRRELVVPPKLGYGSAGSPPAIPPNETLVFVIDVLAVE